VPPEYCADLFQEKSGKVLDSVNGAHITSGVAIVQTLLRSSLLAVVVLSWNAGRSEGQDPTRRYNPAGSTLSPYLNYFSGEDPGVLDRYHAFVRPTVRLQQTIRQQTARLYQLRGEVEQARQTEAEATGIGGKFVDYSHHFPQPGWTTRSDGRRVSVSTNYSHFFPSQPDGLTR